MLLLFVNIVQSAILNKGPLRSIENVIVLAETKLNIHSYVRFFFLSIIIYFSYPPRIYIKMLREFLFILRNTYFY